MLFAGFAETWWAGQLGRASTAVQLETYLPVHAYPTLGRRRLGAIRRDIQIWVKERSEILAPASVELIYRWVATISKAAVVETPDTYSHHWPDSDDETRSAVDSVPSSIAV